MSDKKGANLDMTQGSPIKLLVLFALPMLVGGVFNLMYNMVDSIVVGRYVSLDALAAIGVTSSTMMCINQLGGAFTNASTVIISQAEGAKRPDLIKKAVAHGLYMSLIVGVVFGLASFFGARPLMKLLGTPENIIDGAVTYIQITGGLTLAMIMYNGAASILRAIGDSRTPLYFLIFSSLLNVALDLLFVLKLNGGVAGVGFATIISQLVSAVLCIVYMVHKYERLRPTGSAWKPDGAMFTEYLHIGIPMAVQSSALCVGMFVITAVINSFGSDIVAAFTIGSKAESLSTITFSNLAFSFAVYAGQNYGAKRFDRIGEGLKKGLVAISALALVSTVVMLIVAEPVAKIFMDADEPNAPYVLEAATKMIRVEAVFYAFLGCIWATNSTLRGIGKVSMTLVSSIVELCSKIGFSVLLPIFVGYIGIWFAAPIGWVLGLVPSTAYLIWWFKVGSRRGAEKTN